MSTAPVVAVELSGFEFNIWLHRGAPIVARHQRACREKSQAQWALGDWLLEMSGSVRNPDLYPWFLDCLALAANHYGYTVGTFQEFRRVAKVFPAAADRVPGLSWKHHQAVAAIAVEQERDAWLFSAKIHGWSKTKLQAEIASCREAGTSVPLSPAQPRAYPVGFTKTQEDTLAGLAKQTGLGVAQVKDLIVGNFLDAPAKVQEFAEAYTLVPGLTA